MSKGQSLKKLAWIVAVELALMQPAFAQDEPAPTPLAPESATAEAQPELGVAPSAETVAETPVEPSATSAAQAVPSGTSTAEAISAAEPEADDSPRSRVFEEIIVTAQKREENLVDVPVTVQAFSAEALDARGISSTMDLMKATPGLDFGVQAGDFASVFLRGIGSEAWLTSDPSVASYVDGVYYSFTPSLIQDLGGIERVEVLKGPQGTLFGRNAIAGAISVITKEPDFEERSVTVDSYSGSYQGDTGQDDAFAISKTTIFANVPLTETLAMNVSSFFEYDKQQWDNESTVGGEPVPAKKTYSARVKMRWQPTEEFELRGTLQGSKREGTATLAANIRPTPLGRILFGVDGVDENKRIVNPGLPIYGHLGSTVANLTGFYYKPWFDTKLLGSVQVHSNPYNYDYDGAEAPIASFIVHKHYAKIQEAELQFSSNDTSWGSDWLTWTGGAFYFRNTQGFDPVELTVGGFDPSSIDTITASLPLVGEILQTGIVSQLGVDQALEGRVLPLLSDGLGFPAYALSNIGTLRTESRSFYLQATAKLADWVSLTLGGRYQHERRGVLESVTSLRIGQGAVEVFPWTAARDARDNPLTTDTLPLTAFTKGFTPKVTLDFRPFDDDTLIFLTYQKAIKAHSYNAFAFYLRPAYVPEEKIRAYEVGFKGSLLDGVMRYSVGVFKYELENLQTQFISLLNGGALSLDVAGDAESKGIDFDITTFVLPSIFDSLVVTANGAFIDATYTEYKNGDGQNLTTGLFSTGNDYTGNRVTRTPDFSGSIAITNTWQIPSGSIEVSANMYHNSGFFYVASEDPRYEQEAYDLIGAKVSYLWDRYRLRTTLSVENLTDEFYTTGTLILDPGMLATLGLQRTVGLKFQYSF
ncbi:MAG: TonB-dependent receptor domain-containing protein [Panacagrimonas sp.]